MSTAAPVWLPVKMTPSQRKNDAALAVSDSDMSLVIACELRERKSWLSHIGREYNSSHEHHSYMHARACARASTCVSSLCQRKLEHVPRQSFCGSAEADRRSRP